MPLPSVVPKKAKEIAPPKTGVDVMYGPAPMKTTPAFKDRAKVYTPQLGLGLGMNR